ncbi:hypothetical protein M422DRAFT_187257, partial [Sphaerobolus stellatus SS14]
KDNRTIYRRYGRAHLGNRAIIPARFIRGDRFSVLPALTVDGYICVRIVRDSVDSAEFFDFVVEELLPLMNPYPGDRSVLILDNCAIHKSQALRTMVEAHGNSYFSCSFLRR